MKPSSKSLPFDREACLEYFCVSYLCSTLGIIDEVEWRGDFDIGSLYVSDGCGNSAAACWNPEALCVLVFDHDCDAVVDNADAQPIPRYLFKALEGNLEILDEAIDLLGVNMPTAAFWVSGNSRAESSFSYPEMFNNGLYFIGDIAKGAEGLWKKGHQSLLSESHSLCRPIRPMITELVSSVRSGEAFTLSKTHVQKILNLHGGKLEQKVYEEMRNGLERLSIHLELPEALLFTDVSTTFDSWDYEAWGIEDYEIRWTDDNWNLRKMDRSSFSCCFIVRIPSIDLSIVSTLNHKGIIEEKILTGKKTPEFKNYTESSNREFDLFLDFENGVTFHKNIGIVDTTEFFFDDEHDLRKQILEIVPQLG